MRTLCIANFNKEYGLNNILKSKEKGRKKYKIYIIWNNTYGDYMYYINCFFIYSFFGFLLENLISIIKKKKKGSGILYGPWTPIYGIGAVLILFISKFLFNILKLEKWLEVLTVLLVITLTLTFIEWISGVLIEKIFHVTF